MKFAKNLEDNVVPEWRSKYIDYKGGKKKIKAIVREARSNQSNQSPYINNNNNNNNNIIFRTPKLSGNSPYVQAGRAAPSPARSVLRKPAPSPFTIPIAATTGPAHSSPLQVATCPEPLARFTTAPSPKNDVSTQYGAIGEPENRGGFSDMDFALPEPMQELTRHNTWSGPTLDTQDNGRRGILKKRNDTIISIQRRPTLLKRVFTTLGRKAGGPQVGKDYPLDDESQSMAAEEFNLWLECELHKIDEFYRQKENDAVTRMAALKQQLHTMKDQRNTEQERKREKKLLQTSNEDVHGNKPANWIKSVQSIKESFSSKTPAATEEDPTSPGMDALQKITTAPGPKLIGDPKRDYMPGRVKPTNEVPYQTAKRKLKAAVVEYYRGLELLKSYCTHNREGFRKITKKFDKATGLRTSKKYMAEQVNKSYFGSSDVLDSMIGSTEDLYARYFEKGSRKHAIERLRTREKSKLHYSSIFRSGIALGLAGFAGVSALVMAVRQMQNEDDEDKKHEIEYLLQIWGGFFLPILFMHLFVLNCRAWAKNKINYVFIFEFDTRHNLDYRELLEIPALLMLMMCICMWLNFQDFWPDALPPVYYPILFLCLAGFVILNPFPILYHQSRKWFANAHFRLLLSGLFPVEFRDFWLGDMFCSLTYTLGNLALFGCLYRTDWDSPEMCNSSHSRGMGFMTALPACWRLLQCLRRYRDTKNAFPHLANGGKYTFTILYYVTLSLWRLNSGDSHARAVFVTFAIISSVYSTAWDLVMDWSLLNPYAKHPFLRDTLGFKNPYGYYAALLLDPLLRFNWIFYLIFQHHTQHSAALSFLLSLSELFRRWMWAFFRLENEHCTNVNCYRASREDLPLPYRLPAPTPHAPAYQPIVTTTTATAKVSPFIAAGSSTTGASSGIDLESQTRPSFRRRSSIAASPALRALSTVGHVLTKAHAQDFERRRTRIEEDEARVPDYADNESDDEDDDDEEGHDHEYTPSSEEEGRLGEIKNGKRARISLENVHEEGAGEGSSGEGSSTAGSRDGSSGRGPMRRR